MPRICALHVVAAAGLTVLALGCARPGPASLDEIAEGYVRVSLQLAQHNPDLVDDWRGPASWKPGPRQPVAPLVARIDGLQADLRRRSSDVDGDDAYRHHYLDEQLKAIRVLADRLGGVTMTFAAELGGALPPVDSSRLVMARESLGHTLSGNGSLAARYAGYRRGLAVPASRVEPVMLAALAACREASREMRLPGDERVDLAFGHGSPWDGFARYLGNHRTRIEINLDASLDVTRALRLACHEGYPGHHAQNVLIDDELVRKRRWTEFALAPGFGPFLFVTEGAAEVGTDLAFPPAKRIELYRNVLLPAAGLPAGEAERLVAIEELIAVLEPAIGDVVQAYLENRISQAAAIDRLRDEALTPEPEGLLAFAERRRARSLAYTLGRDEVRKKLGSAGLPGLRHMFDQPFRVF